MNVMSDKYIMSGSYIQKFTFGLKILLLTVLLITVIAFGGGLSAKATNVLAVQAVQQMEIEGYVYNQDNTPLFGAIIKEEGTNNMVTANKDGSYSIKVMSRVGLKLTFSFVGMKSQTIEIQQRTKVDVVLEVIEQNLQEVVVTGYGDINKDEYTGSANVIQSNEIANRPVGSFENALSGLSPGLVVASSG